jgi:hypothetical protein
LSESSQRLAKGLTPTPESQAYLASLRQRNTRWLPVIPPAVPAADPKTRTLGRLRGWIEKPEEHAIDITPVKDTADFVAVDAKGRTVAALHADGRLALFTPSNPAPAAKPLPFVMKQESSWLEPEGTTLARFGRSGDCVTLIDDAGDAHWPGDGITGVWVSPCFPVTQCIDIVGQTGGLNMMLGKFERRFWFPDGGAPETRWRDPAPFRGAKFIAISASSQMGAVAFESGDVAVWNRTSDERTMTRGHKFKDVAVCGDRVFGLSTENKVVTLVSPISSERGDTILATVRWIKPGGGSTLLCGLQDGTLVTDPYTEKARPGLKAILQLAGKPHHDAVTLGELGLFWIEPASS